MTKKITALAHGTRGNVQPAITLGKALQDAGYHVRLLASPNFCEWIETHGLETAVSRVNVQTVMESAGGQKWAWVWAEDGVKTAVVAIQQILYQT